MLFVGVLSVTALACSSAPESTETGTPGGEGGEVEASPPTPGAVEGSGASEDPIPRPAQRGVHGNRRPHEVNQSDGLRLHPASSKAPAANQVSFRVEGKERVLVANGVPGHGVGQFPSKGNPHAITEQRYSFRVPAEPALASTLTPLGQHDFGLAVNGVPFDPGAAEFYLGDRNSGWQYEALAGAIGLGIDANHAHVQPTGAYHYHGLPDGLLSSLGVREGEHSPLVGWAADGFPIYALYGYADAKVAGAVEELRSSYRLREGSRPAGEGHPGGTYDGTFTADYRFVAGAGALDECNGREAVTPDFPDGTYAYFLTRDWPVIPRCYKGTPSPTMTTRSGGGPGGPGAGRPPGGGGPGQGGHDRPRGPRGGRPR